MFSMANEFKPLTDVRVDKSRLVSLEALTSACENFVQVDHEGEHEHKPLTLHMHASSAAKREPN
jgi:hypothetical protein